MYFATVAGGKNGCTVVIEKVLSRMLREYLDTFDASLTSNLEFREVARTCTLIIYLTLYNFLLNFEFVELKFRWLPELFCSLENIVDIQDVLCGSSARLNFGYSTAPQAEFLHIIATTPRSIKKIALVCE